MLDSPGAEDIPENPHEARGQDWLAGFDEGQSQAKIRNFRWHDLRHTFASRLVIAGVPLRAVQMLLGHKRIETTLRYSHLSETHLREAVERLTVKSTDTTSDTIIQRVQRGPKAKSA